LGQDCECSLFWQIIFPVPDNLSLFRRKNIPVPDPAIVAAARSRSHAMTAWFQDFAAIAD
jgi:hypothetical protein